MALPEDACGRELATLDAVRALALERDTYEKVEHAVQLLAELVRLQPPRHGCTISHTRVSQTAADTVLVMLQLAVPATWADWAVSRLAATATSITNDEATADSADSAASAVTTTCGDTSRFVRDLRVTLPRSRITVCSMVAVGPQVREVCIRVSLNGQPASPSSRDHAGGCTGPYSTFHPLAPPDDDSAAWRVVDHGDPPDAWSSRSVSPLSSLCDSDDC